MRLFKKKEPKIKFDLITKEAKLTFRLNYIDERFTYHCGTYLYKNSWSYLFYICSGNDLEIDDDSIQFPIGKWKVGEEATFTFGSLKDLKAYRKLLVKALKKWSIKWEGFSPEYNTSTIKSMEI